MSNIRLNIDRSINISINEHELINLVNNVFEIIKLNQNTELSILLTNNEYITTLNSKYRGLNEPTDVLSFSPKFSGKYYGENKESEIEEIYFPTHTQMTNHQLGDIAISIEYIIKKNKTDSKIINYEIKKLLIHGILHLNGYDHEKPKEEKLMLSITNNIIKKLKI
jgi:probable rRNA maturation factor